MSPRKMGQTPFDAGGRVASAMPELSWVDTLVTLHRAVRSAGLNSGRRTVGLTNAKGDNVKVFDIAANNAAVTFLENLSVPLLALV